MGAGREGGWRGGGGGIRVFNVHAWMYVLMDG